MNLLQMSCVMTWAQKKFSLQPQKKKGRFFKKKIFKLGFRPRNFSFEKKKFLFSPQKCKLEHCMSNGSKVLIYLSFLLKEAVFSCCCNSKQRYGCYVSLYKNQKLGFSIFFYFKILRTDISNS